MYNNIFSKSINVFFIFLNLRDWIYTELNLYTLCNQQHYARIMPVTHKLPEFDTFKHSIYIFLFIFFIFNFYNFFYLTGYLEDAVSEWQVINTPTVSGWK